MQAALWCDDKSSVRGTYMQCSIVGFLERRSKYSAPNSVKGWELMSRFWWPDRWVLTPIHFQPLWSWLVVTMVKEKGCSLNYLVWNE
jgi:hypothetical protein